MHTHPFLGASVRALIAEMERVSDRLFPQECIRRFEVERWSESGRRSLFELKHGRCSVVKSLTELHSALHAVEASLVTNGRCASGYERVLEKYHELASMRWVVTVTAHPLEGELATSAWNTWAIGLVAVDPHLLTELRDTLTSTEESIRTTPYPDLVDRSQLANLSEDLTAAGVPHDGLSSPTPKPTPESDASPCEYFLLDDGRSLRMCLRPGLPLTAEQHKLADRIARSHFQRLADLNSQSDAIATRLRRAGFSPSSVRFVRSEAELGRAPERSVSLDTDKGFLEIRTTSPLDSPDHRRQIGLIARDYLNAEGIRAFTGDGYPPSAVQFVGHVLRRFHFVARALAGRHDGRLPLQMTDEYDVQDLLRGILLSYFDDVVAEDPNPKFAGKSTRIDLALRTAKVFIEVKRPRKGQAEGKVGDELIADVPHYRQRGDCETLFCFVYDPDHRITNPTVFEADIEKLSSDDMVVRAVVNQG